MSTLKSDSIIASLEEAHGALRAFISQPGNVAKIQSMAEGLASCFKSGGKVLVCGNGGSACDALHFAEEFTGRFRDDRAPLPVIPLLEAGNLTCVANDYGFENVFARGVEAYGKPGDIFIGLSTSGNSLNVIKAVQSALARGVEVYLFLGKSGGKLKGQGNQELVVGSQSTERVQEVHMTVLHILIESVERLMFPENYAGR